MIPRLIAHTIRNRQVSSLKGAGESKFKYSENCCHQRKKTCEL